MIINLILKSLYEFISIIIWEFENELVEKKKSLSDFRVEYRASDENLKKCQVALQEAEKKWMEVAKRVRTERKELDKTIKLRLKSYMVSDDEALMNVGSNYDDQDNESTTSNDSKSKSQGCKQQ